MKLSIDDQVDALYLKFNDNKVAETIQLELEVNIDIDSNNKIVGLEVLHYSKLKWWTNNLFLDNDIDRLSDDDLVFFMHQGYVTAWFNKANIIDWKSHTVCKCYAEGQKIHDDTVENYIQTEVDFIIKHR